MAKTYKDSGYTKEKRKLLRKKQRRKRRREIRELKRIYNLKDWNLDTDLLEYDER